MKGPPYKLLYAGLAFAVLTQVLVAWFVIEWGQAVSIAPNVAAAVVCVMVGWLIRQRQKGRL